MSATPPPTSAAVPAGVVSHSEDHFGAWRLLRRIGEGGFADVFLAVHGGDGAPKGPVVLKRLHPHLCDQADMADMFETEARVLGELDHASIVRLHSLERGEGGRLAMVMEWVDGIDLAQVFDHAMTIGQAMPLAAAVRLTVDVAEALHHAHERIEHDGDASLRIVHRDIKPDNLLIDTRGRIKLIDFGCAKATLQTHLTRPGIRKGTLDYMSPEQCLGRAVDRRTDIFSLGVVLYELVTMTRMYADASDARVMERIVHEVAKPPSWHDNRVNASLDLAILRALEKRPEDRYGTAAEMARALQWWLDRYGGDTDPRAALACWLREDMRLLTPTGAGAEPTVIDAPSFAAAAASVASAPSPLGAAASRTDVASGLAAASGPQPSAPGAATIGRAPATADLTGRAGVAAGVPAAGGGDRADPLQVVFRPVFAPRQGGLVLRARSSARRSGLSPISPTSPAAGTGVDPRHSDDASLPGRGEVVDETRLSALQSLLDRRTNLSPDPQALVGREAELLRLEALFAAGDPLVVIEGPPGVGKSALARASALALLRGPRRMQGGVWWVGVDDARDGGALAHAIAVALGIQVDAEAPVVALAAALAARGPMRLVLDGANGLDASGLDTVDVIAAGAAELELLLTARVRPDGLEAAVLPLEPLALPRRADALAASPVGALFAQAARQVVPGFAIDVENGAQVLALLRGLRGMPGAILLAAAQLDPRDPVSTVLQLVARLPSEAAPRTSALDAAALDAALEWGWHQASEEERRLLAAASLYHGGFDLEAIVFQLNGMLGREAPQLAPADVAALLERLRERNLVAVFEPAELPGTRRFKVVRHARAFVRDRLLERSDADAARRGHAEHFAALGAALCDAAEGPEGRVAVQRLRLELPNLLAIVQRALRVQPPTERSLRRALQTLASLWPAIDRTGRYEELVELVTPTLIHAAAADDGVGSADGGVASWARSLLEVLCAFATACLRRRDPQLAAAGAAIERARCIAAHLDEDALTQVAVVTAEHLLQRGDPQRAAAFLQVVDAGASPVLSVAAALLGARVDRALARLESAETRLNAALQRAQRGGFEHLAACTLLQRGALRLDLDDAEGAAADLHLAYTIFDGHGDESRAGRCLLELARTAQHGGDVAHARQLAGAAARIYRRLGRDDLLAPLRAWLGDDGGDGGERH